LVIVMKVVTGASFIWTGVEELEGAGVVDVDVELEVELVAGAFWTGAATLEEGVEEEATGAASSPLVAQRYRIVSAVSSHDNEFTSSLYTV